MKYLVIYLIVMNLLTCIVYGVDKLKAIAGARRISEKTLLTFTFLGGSLGAFLGMKLFRHKTCHTKFKVAVPFFMGLHVILLVLLIYAKWHFVV